MSKKVPKNTKTEEIDLIQIFNMIGNGFSRLFKFIGSVISWLFFIGIRLLIFVKENVYKIVIPIVVATGIGIVLDSFQPPVYTSTITVQPNFGSNVQLYDNISYFNELAKNGGSIKLANVLGTTSEAAGKLRGFSISAIVNENTKLKYYSDFIKEVRPVIEDENQQGVLLQPIDYDKFTENLAEVGFDKHVIKVYSSDQNFPTEIQDAIVNSVDENNYFDNTKKTIAENIEISKSILLKQLTDVDSLRSIYNCVIEYQAKSDRDLPVGSTNILFADKQQPTNELNLFSETRAINKDLIDLNTRKANLENTVTVFSNLNPIGNDHRPIMSTYMFKLFVLSAILTFFIFGIFEFNKFLDSQKAIMAKKE